MADSRNVEMIAIPEESSEEIPVYLKTIAKLVAMGNGKDIETVITGLLRKFNDAGNALTAVKLANAHKIGNAEFDGSADITLDQIGAAAKDHKHAYVSSIEITGTTVKVTTGDDDSKEFTTQDINVKSIPNTETKAYVGGVVSEEGKEVTGTQIFDTGVYIDTTPGRLRVESLNIADKAVLYWDETKQGLKILFL